MSPVISLHNATIVLPDDVATRPLVIDAGRVAAGDPAGAWALDLREHLIVPGLINAHDHLQLNNIPRLPAHAPFPNSYVWMLAFQPHFKEQAVARACSCARGGAALAGRSEEPAVRGHDGGAPRPLGAVAGRRRPSRCGC